MIGKAACSLQKSPRFCEKRGDFLHCCGMLCKEQERPRREGNGTGEGSVPLEPLFPLGLLLQIFDRVAAKLAFRILLGCRSVRVRVHHGGDDGIAVGHIHAVKKIHALEQRNHSLFNITLSIEQKVRKCKGDRRRRRTHGRRGVIFLQKRGKTGQSAVFML